MKYLKLIIFILLCQLPLFSQSALLFQRVEIPLDSTNIERIATLGIDISEGIHLPGNKFSIELSEEEISILKSNAVPYAIRIYNVSEYYRTRKHSDAPTGRDAAVCNPEPTIDPPKNFKKGSMIGYYTYQEFLDVLTEMHTKYPQLISAYKPIGNYKTHNNNPLYWLRISDNPDVEEDEPKVLYTALHHAREPLSLTQLVYFMWYVLEHYETDAEIKALVDNTEMYFIPMINPDGYRYNEFTDPMGGGMWRKNLKPNTNGGMGVDLNRNYGKFWGYDNLGSSPSSVSQIYRGLSAFSEVETQAVRSFCLEHDFKFALNHHAFGNLLLYPWGHNASNCPDSLTFRRVADRMVDKNKFTAGTSLETVGYYANGTSDDWMYGGDEKTSPTIALTAEVGEFYDGFWPFEDRILPLSQSCLEMNLQILRSAHNNLALFYKEIPAMSGEDTILTLDAIQTGISPAPVTVTISEPTDRMIFTQPVQVISLNTNDIQKIKFDFAWGNVKNGDQITVYFNWTDGYTTHQDSVNIGFYDVKETLLADEFENLDNWTASTPWGITTSNAYSGGTCVTDSPTGTYSADEFSYLALKQALVTSGQYQKVYLRYYAKWAFQPNFDYAAVSIEDNTAGTTEYLCGYNMTKGTLEQAAENSVYEGNALKWEEEVIDISQYNNSVFNLIFELGADETDQRDGLYIDKLEVVGYREKTTSTGAMSSGSLRIYPNPVQDYFTVNGVADYDRVEIFNLLGNSVFYQNNIDHSIAEKYLGYRCDLDSGMYLVHFSKNGMLISSQKLLVVK